MVDICADTPPRPAPASPAPPQPAAINVLRTASGETINRARLAGEALFVLPAQLGCAVPVAEPGPATPRAAVPSLPSQLPRGWGTARPATGLEHVEAAQPTPAPRCLRNTATHTATNVTLPQVWELCLEEPCEEPKRRPSDATARLATDSSTGQCFWATTRHPQSSH